jgi:hypothetical protein
LCSGDLREYKITLLKIEQVFLTLCFDGKKQSWWCRNMGQEN